MEAVTLACQKQTNIKKTLSHPGHRHPRSTGAEKDFALYNTVAITTNKLQYVSGFLWLKKTDC